jgi:hypothetical protein
VSIVGFRKSDRESNAGRAEQIDVLAMSAADRQGSPISSDVPFKRHFGDRRGGEPRRGSRSVVISFPPAASAM